MSRLFRHKSLSARRTMASMPPDHPESGYSSLLPPPEPNVSPQSLQRHRRSKSSSNLWAQHGFTIYQEAPRPWLGTAESRQSWTGERQPPRKLVKEQHNGSGRPSFSVELSDSDGEKEKGIVRRQINRLRDLYRRDKSKLQHEPDFL